MIPSRRSPEEFRAAANPCTGRIAELINCSKTRAPDRRRLRSAWTGSGGLEHLELGDPPRNAGFSVDLAKAHESPGHLTEIDRQRHHGRIGDRRVNGHDRRTTGPSG